MKTVSGHLKINKTERKEIETVLEHCERDLSYGSGGTFGDGDKLYHGEIAKAVQGIQHIRWILSTL